MQPKSILGQPKGFARDYSIDAIPEGYVWDMVDLIPGRRGARLEGRGAWRYLTAAMPGTIWGGRYATYIAGEKLIVDCSNAKLYDVNRTSGAFTEIGAGFATMQQNGAFLRDRVYFFDGAGLAVPKAVSWNGTAWTVVNCGAACPTTSCGVAYKDRLVIAKGSDVHFSPLETDGGPPGAWDAAAKIGVTGTVYGMAPMVGKLLVFHAGRISRISGTIPPGTDIDSDMYVDTLTDQVGATLPATICHWNENVLFADERGVHMTDGATTRNLTEQGGIGDFWREAYSLRVAGYTVCATVYFDMLMVSIITMSGSYFLVCDLNSRAWFRFTNHPANSMIPSEGSVEEVYAGHNLTNRLSLVSEMVSEPFGQVAPLANEVDGNGQAVLPVLETGWEKMGPEGQQQFKQVYLSYQHESATSVDRPDAVNVSFRTDPLQVDLAKPFTTAGLLPRTDDYERKRLAIGRRGYGIQIRVASVKPTRIFRINDIGIAAHKQDRGKVSRGVV